MIQYMRYAFIGLCLILIGYFSFRTYLYYFDTTEPQVSMVGLDEGKTYAGDMSVKLKGTSPYKVAQASVWLDDQELEHIKLNRQSFEHALAMPNLDNGPHTLKAEVIDGTKSANKTVFERKFHTDNLGLQAALVSTSLDHKVAQGRCLHVKFQVNKPTIHATLQALSGNHTCFAKSKNSLVYEAFVPVECEQVANEYPFSIEVKDKVGNKVLLEDKFQVTPVNFTRKILHVQNNKLKSELEFTSLQERDLEDALDRITRSSVKEKLWNGAFDVPILMTRVSTDFGVIRTSQERGRTVHKALDLVAEPKSVVWASQAGVVVLKDRFTHSGNTVVLDHGNGIISLYFHLHDFADIEVGQKVKKGNPLGRMGMTGFANGQHLHWEIRVNNVAVDPMQWTQLVG